MHHPHFKNEKSGAQGGQEPAYGRMAEPGSAPSQESNAPGPAPKGETLPFTHGVLSLAPPVSVCLSVSLPPALSWYVSSSLSRSLSPSLSPPPPLLLTLPHSTSESESVFPVLLPPAHKPSLAKTEAFVLAPPPNQPLPGSHHLPSLCVTPTCSCFSLPLPHSLRSSGCIISGPEQSFSDLNKHTAPGGPC